MVCSSVSQSDCVSLPPQPYDHQRVVTNYHHASKEHIQQAIDAALAAREEWERTPFEHRCAFLSIHLVL